jgi:hypothetical protein
MSDIKFGTDGWRALIAKDYTVNNVARVTIAVSEWLKKNYDNPSVVIGHDCRFGGEMFSQTAAKVLANHGIKVEIAKGFVSTPMVSLGVVKHSASLGVVITASHNPPTYNGYKLKGDFGGPLLPKNISEVEALIPNECNIDLDSLDFNEYVDNGIIKIIDLENMYCEHVSANFDLDLINNSINSNIGDAVIQGIESDITILTDGFTIIAGFALTDPKLDEDYLLDGALLAKRGSVLANVPRFKSSLAINKTFDLNLLGNFGGLKSGSWDFNVSRTGERKSSITNPINQGAYSLANFSLALRGDHFTTIFYIDNLLMRGL